MWDFDRGAPPASAGERSPDHRAQAASAGHGLGGHFEVSYTVPSRCAEELRAGSADIGIIPAIAYATIPELAILPDVAIAARGPVRSILLVSRKPLEQIRTVAADTSSRSSVALAQVLFQKFLGGEREFAPMEPHLEAMLRACDAALLIGDPALRIPQEHPGYMLFDLGELWRRFTGLPFVFAFWAVRAAALRDAPAGLDVLQVFRDSRDHGLEPDNLKQTARLWAPRVGIPEADAHNYLSKHIHYYLDDECLSGLELFYRHAHACGLIAQVPELRFAGMASCSFR
jgi:chorismate dehydratase